MSLSQYQIDQIRAAASSKAANQMAGVTQTLRPYVIGCHADASGQPPIDQTVQELGYERTNPAVEIDAGYGPGDPRRLTGWEYFGPGIGQVAVVHAIRQFTWDAATQTPNGPGAMECCVALVSVPCDVGPNDDDRTTASNQIWETLANALIANGQVFFSDAVSWETLVSFRLNPHPVAVHARSIWPEWWREYRQEDWANHGGGWPPPPPPKPTGDIKLGVHL